MKFSVIIATCDRPEMVLDCVRSFKDQIPVDVEVVVVDAGIHHLVDQNALQAEWGNSRVVRSNIRNAGAQRNAGVLAAKGEIIVFLDDDVLVQPGWWPGIVSPITGSGQWAVDRGQWTVDSGQWAEDGERKTEDGGRVGAVAGAVWCNPSPTFTDERGGYVNWLGEPVQITHRSDKAPREVDWALTTNMAVLKEAFLGVGGFADIFGIYDEDVDLGLKIRGAGYRILFQPGIAVYHYFMKRGPKPVTFRSEFLLGRNRSMMLVRSFGLLSRVWIFLITAPWIRLWNEMVYSKKRAPFRLGYVVAYMVGAWKGVVDGLRHPISGDRI